MSTPLQIRTLGSLAISLDAQPVDGFDSRKVAALLVYLACTGRAHPREVLAEMLWEERTQSQALANLRVALTSLRQQVGTFVEISRESVGMAPQADWWLDVTAYEGLLGQGDPADLEAALELYQGDFLAGFYVDSQTFEDWMLLERERLRLSALEAHDRLIGHALENETYSAGIAHASQLLQMDPLREKTYRQLMQLLANSGQREAALAQYETCRRLLADELGVTPTPETTSLYQRLREGVAFEFAPQLAEAQAAEPITNPYKGLRAFQECDAPDFFGRETLTTRLLDRLQEDGPFARFLAVVGPSGSGKSSVVRAGLIPALRGGALPGAEAWCIISLLPGTHPFDELDIALARVAGTPDVHLLDELKRDPRGLLRAVRRVLPEDSPELLLIIDQFEEVFTLTGDPAEAKFLLDSLVAAVTEPRSPLRVLITLRADFYDRPLMYPDFSEMVRQRTEAVVPLTTTELAQAISGPAVRVGVGLEAGLAATIVGEVTEQPGALPMLQYALTELFDQRTDHTLTLDIYRTIGGALGALARRADVVYQQLSPAAQAATRQMFLRLVTLGEGTEDIRRRVPESEILAVGGEAAPLVLDAFDHSRLLTFDQNPASGEPTIELAHEAIIRAWDRLRIWLDESRADIRLQRLLAANAGEWIAFGRETSYLLTGARLAQFVEWAAGTQLALTQDERAFLETSVEEEQRRQARQRRLRNSVLVAAVVIAIIMAGLTALAMDRERLAVQREGQARDLALVNGAQAALAQNDLDTALALAVAANQAEHPSASAQTLLSEAAYQPGTLRRLVSDGLGVIMSIAVSPDGRRVLSGAEAGHVTYWDLETGDVLYDLHGHDTGGIVLDVDISPDGLTGVSIAEDQTIILWDLETGEMLRQFGQNMILSPHALSVVFSPDGQTVLSNNGGRSVYLEVPDDEEATLILWDTATGEPIRTFRGHSAMTGRLAISPDGQQALSGDFSGQLILWDVATGAILAQSGAAGTDGYKVPTDIAFLPDGRRALVLYADDTLLLWDLETFEVIRRYREIVGFNSYAQQPLSPDGRTLLRGGFRGDLALVDVETGATITPLSGTNIGAAFTPDGNAVLLGGVSEIRMVDLHHGAEIRQFAQISTDLPIGITALSLDNRTLLVALGGGSMDDGPGACAIVVLDTETGEERRRFGTDESPIRELGCPINSMVFSPDGQTVLIGGHDGRYVASGLDQGQAVLWDVTTGAVIVTLAGIDGRVSAGAFSPDGRWVLTGDQDEYAVILWDAATGEALRRLSGHTGSVWSVAFSPDGQTALSGAQDGQVILWDVLSGAPIRQIQAHVGGANSVAFSPDGQRALSGGDDGRLVLWDLASGESIMSMVAGYAVQVAFAQDGQIAFSNGERVSLWDLGSGEEIRRYWGAEAWGLLTLSGDATSFFGLDAENRVHQWRIDWGQDLLDWTRANRYIRDLTCKERDQYRLEPTCPAAEALSSS